MYVCLFLPFFIKKDVIKVKKSVLTGMKHLRGEGNVPEALLGAVVAFHLSGKSNRDIEALTDVSNSQVSTIIRQRWR
jgi:hypothetical protein